MPSDAPAGLLFVKMEGLGNDFVVIDLRQGAVPDWLEDRAAIARLCDRHRGIGADGVLAVLPPRPGVTAAARMRVRNADGSEAEMCGNGLRCVARYLAEADLGGQNPLYIETGAGVLRCTLTGSPAAPDPLVEVAMGAPRLLRAAVPMLGPADEPCLDEPVALPGLAPAPAQVRLTAVSMGNPHAVIFAPAQVRGPALRALAEQLGPQVEHHPLFPSRTNVELCQRHGPADYEVVVWERGCGITQACGTGACAVAVAACRLGLAKADAWLTMELLGGPLQVRVLPQERDVLMRGPARKVYSGRLA
jgi:diaminopimelate epimerase